MNPNEAFSRFLPSKYNNQKPVINLIQIRCCPAFIAKIPPTSLENKLFNNLIFFESHQIQSLSKRLLKYSLIDSFQPFYQLFKFNCNNFIHDLDILISNHQIIKSQQKSEECVDQYLIITFYFYLLEFLLFHKQFLPSRNETIETSKSQSVIFVKLIQELNLFGKPQDDVIESIHSYLFIQLILHFLNYNSTANINQMNMPPKMDCHIEWTQEMYDQCSVQFLIGPVFRMSSKSGNGKNLNSNQFAYSLILSKFLHKSIKSNETINPSRILEIIYSMLIEQRISFENVQICSILLPLVQKLNPKAIKIISILSSISKSLASSIKDDFIQLPPLLFQKIMGNAINDFETKNDVDENSTDSFINRPTISKELFSKQSNLNGPLLKRNKSKEKLNKSQQKLKLSKTKSDFFEKKKFYKEKDSKAFENGFISAHSDVNFNLFNLFNQNGLNHFLIDFFYSMENANNDCLNEFIFAYYKLLSIYIDSDFYFDLYVIVFMFIDKFKDRINLSDLFPFLFDSQVFNPSTTIFNNYEKKNLSILTTIRFNILNVYTTEMDSILPSFFIKSENNVFLFSELISYILQSPNFQSNHSFIQPYISKKFIHSFFKVLNALINERYELNNEKDKDGIFSAFQTNLSFLFNLLNDNSRSESLFQIHSFCRKFLSLIFIDSLQKVTITTIRNFLLTINPTSMVISQITVCISQLLQTLESSNENSKDADQSLSISISIVQNLISVLSSNGSISPYFTNIFDFVLNLKHFPNLLEYSLTFTSLISRNIPNFKLKSYQLKKFAHIIVNECKVSDADAVSDQTYLILLNLCAATTTLGNSTMFLIKQPTFIPLVFIVFQNSSTKLRSILQNFIDLCNYSINNCFACHFSGIDLLLLEFIYNFKIKNSRKINFRQIEFDLKFESEDITKYILPFLSLILTYSTDSIIISKIIDILNEGFNNDIGLIMSSFLLNSITNSNSQLSILHPLGFNIPFFVVDNVSPDIFNKRFVFTFWIKIDKLIALSEKDSIEIFRISNQKSLYRKSNKINIVNENNSYIQQKESDNLNITNQNGSSQIHKKKKLSATTFRIFVKRGVFYFSFCTPGSQQITEEILQNVESNTWLFCAFVTQRSSLESSSACLYSGNHVGYCQDVNKIYFPESNPLTISFGGKKIGINSLDKDISKDRQIFKGFNFFRINKSNKENNSTEIINNSIEQNEGNLAGVLGPFALYDTLLTEEELLSISKAGPTSINDEVNGWIIKSSKSSNEFLLQNSVLKNVNTIKNESSFAPHSIIYEICLHNHIFQLSKIFFNINKTPEKFLGTIIGIMKQVFSTSTVLQKEFIYFDIIAKLIISSSIDSKNQDFIDSSKNQNRINYHLYLNFLSLFECISYSRTSELFFDSLLINVELWYICCNASNFSRIIFHWSHTLVNMYPSFFKRPNFLTKLYKTYFALFDRNMLDKSEIDNDEMKALNSPIFNYTNEEINECDERFLCLLEEATKLQDSFENEFLFYFYSIITTIEKRIEFKEDEGNVYYQRLKFFLNVVIKSANKFNEFNKLFAFLIDLISEVKYLNNLEIIKLSIFAIHELCSPKWFESMSSVGYIILTNQKKNEKDSMKWEKLIKSLLKDIEFYPGIMHIISFYILNTESSITHSLESINAHKNETKEEEEEIEEDDDLKITDLDFSKSMNKLMIYVLYQTRDKEITPVFVKNIISDEYWFLWLLFVAIQSKNEECHQSIMLLISNFVSFSENAEKQLNRLIEIIFIITSFTKNIDEYAILLDLFVNILAHGTISMSAASTSLIFSLFFNFCSVFHNVELIKQVKSSPLFEDQLPIENEDNESISYDDENPINTIIKKFIKFANNENVVKNYKLRFGLSLDEDEKIGNKKSSSLEKLYDLLIQTLQMVDTKLNFPGYKKILDYIPIVLSSRYDEQKEKNEIELINRKSGICNLKFNDAINYFNDSYLNDIFKSIKDINETIGRIKNIEILNDKIENENHFIDVPILSSSFQKTTVNNYFNFIKNFVSLELNSTKEICRDFYSFLFPFKTKFKKNYDILPIKNVNNYFDDDEIRNMNKKETNSKLVSLIKTKVILYNFNDEPKEVYYILHLNNLLSQIIDASNNVKLFTIKLKTILFINVNIKNVIELFTHDQGSFYLLFNEDDINEKNKIISELTHSLPHLNKSIKDSLNPYLTKPMNNYEYLMYLNIISGFSFHNPDPNKRPSFPLFKENLEPNNFTQKENSKLNNSIHEENLEPNNSTQKVKIEPNNSTHEENHEPNDFTQKEKLEPTNSIQKENSELNSFIQKEIPVYDFLFLQKSKNPFINLIELEKIDDSLIDSYAKAKFKENYFPKFKAELSAQKQQLSKSQNHNETHRIIKDLTLNPDKIRKSGFFHLIKEQNEYVLFYIIIKREGLIHFIQISDEPYIQHFSTQKCELLIKENNVDSNENADEDAVVIEDFEIGENLNEEKIPGILIFSKKKKKMQRITPFDCSSLVDINFELSTSLFSSLYSFSYIHQSSSSLMNSIRSSSANFYSSKNSVNSSSSSLLISSNTTTNKAQNAASQSNSKPVYQHFYRSDFKSADTDLNFFSMCKNELIFIFNKCSIKVTSNLKKLINENKNIHNLKSENFLDFGRDSELNSKITCIASNEKFKALAVGTEKCKVIVYSINSKEVTTIIDLINKEPEKILITSNYGFVVIEAQKNVFVYTINGQKVGEKEINFDILEWHFTSSSIFAPPSFSATNSSNSVLVESEGEIDQSKKIERKGDFVVFMNSVNDIGVFDASHPDFIQFVSPSSGLIAAFDYMSFRNYNCIIIVSINYGSIIGFYPVQNFLQD